MAIWYGHQVASVATSKHLSELSVQIGSSPKPDNKDHPTYDDITAQFIAKICAPYDAYESHLKQIREQLRQTTKVDCHPTNELQSEVDDSLIPTYQTQLGLLCFAELHERTRKYAAFALLHSYQVHPTDVDDGLQAGYLALWERLQREPELLKDKSLALISKGIIYKALHAIRGDWKFRQHTQAEIKEASKGGWGTHSYESRQTDIRIDVHQAISEFAQHILTAEKGKQANYSLCALYG
ncbi:MAG: hypothetical protein ABI970_14335 [Chloroflexota bacterium]